MLALVKWNNLTKAERKKRYGSRWAKWKRAQRARPSKNKHESRYKVRHHASDGKVKLISRSRHAKIHNKNADGGRRKRGKRGGRGKRRGD